MPESPQRRGQPPRKPEGTVRPQRGGRLKAVTGGCLPKCCRDAGHGETPPETSRCPGAGSGTPHSVAPRVGVLRLGRQRHSGRQVARPVWGGGTPLSPPRQKQGMGQAAAPAEAPRLSPRSLGALRGLSPCLESCVSPGSVTKAWKCQDAHPLRNLPRGAASPRGGGGGDETGKKKIKEMKLLVALQNCVHRVPGQDLNLGFYRSFTPIPGKQGPLRASGSSPKDLPVKPPSGGAGGHLLDPCFPLASVNLRCFLIKGSYPFFVTTPPRRVRFLLLGRQPACVGRGASDSPTGAGSVSAHPCQTRTHEAP